MITKEIAILLYKHLEDTLSDGEAVLLQTWKDEDPGHNEFFEQTNDVDQLTRMISEDHPENLKVLEERIYAKMEKRISFKVVPLYRRGIFRLAAAAILVMLTIGSYFLFFNNKQESGTPPIAKINDIDPPKSNKAKIALPDGTELLLDTMTSYTQNGVTVTKTADGRIIYTGFGDKVVFNTLTNPRGNKVIDIELADKSHVWLNAGSSITYPVAFTGNERKVTMTGEAAFKITHNSTMPFIVTKEETSVTVLGTEFNVNAYEDEPDIRVTLIEGSVKVTNDQRSLTIKPNQQAIISPSGVGGGSSVSLNTNVNMDEVMAWKNGLFTYNSMNIETIMKEVSRYYGVEIVYEVKVPGPFTVDRVPRDQPVSTLLQGLEKTEHVHFKIEGNKITVKP